MIVQQGRVTGGHKAATAWIRKTSSSVIEAQLPVSYVADGQQVPEDIHVANAKSIISLAAKLYKKYGLNHTNGNTAVNSAQAV